MFAPDPKTGLNRLRYMLDTLEAASEERHRNGEGSRVIFTEEARGDLENIFLRDTFPDYFQKLSSTRMEQWEGSWVALNRAQPEELSLSMDYRVVAATEKGAGVGPGPIFFDRIGSVPLGAHVLIESMAVKKDYFAAFTITTSEQVFAATKLLWREHGQAALDTALMAQRAEEIDLPQISGRLLIIPSTFRLDTPEQFTFAVRHFLQGKLKSQYARDVQLTWFDAKAEVGVDWAHLARVSAMQSPARSSQKRTPAAQPMPAFKVLSREVIKNMVKRNPLDANEKVRHFLNLDPDFD
jgi:hypothetical protein